MLGVCNMSKAKKDEHGFFYYDEKPSEAIKTESLDQVPKNSFYLIFNPNRNKYELYRIWDKYFTRDPEKYQEYINDGNMYHFPPKKEKGLF